VFFNNDLTVLQLQKLDNTMSLLKASNHVQVPPHTETLISVRLTNRAAEKFDGQTAIIEPFVSATQRGIFVAKAFVERLKTNKLICRIFNPWQKTCIIPKGSSVATLSSAVLDKDTTNRTGTQPSQTDLLTAADNHSCTHDLLQRCVGRTDGRSLQLL